MAYAIIRTGGKQYRISEGDQLDVEKLPLAEGETATFEEVLCVGQGGDLRVGAPLVEGASVTATVVGQVRAPKVTAFKYKRRKGFHKTKGHRRQMTRLRVETISA